MCPSYRATGEEQHSTRGRARLLWEMLAGALHAEGFQSEAVHEALDLCLSCKACKTECPVQVDMAAYKAEFLAQHYKGRLHPLQHYVFGFADKLARLGSMAPATHQCHSHRPAHQPADQAHCRRGAGARSCRGLRSAATRDLEIAHEEQIAGRETRRLSSDGQVLLVAGYVEQLLPSANTGCRRDCSRHSGFRCPKPGGPHLLRASALRLWLSRCSARISRRRARTHGSADRCGHAVYLSRAELRQCLQG